MQRAVVGYLHRASGEVHACLGDALLSSESHCGRQVAKLRPSVKGEQCVQPIEQKGIV